ncbi:FAD-dependent oxidoreductase [Methylovirgula sp. 4M-Z18]|uniref:FAD-dependent oxidoreductase n=1 Tax=Methylovirgula sp. 4M-Z18 TaxID=2293567 RepID=UPI000E2EC44D|nr:GMC family oxidoreductase [Methylovirgula sp. 4M-Z18]RFB78334.1 GMC family oxidoreductase [Methylovirgula sp. 4M-Z18]
MPQNPAHSTVLIIGSGMGGATLAAGLAASGVQVTMLERGEQLADTSETRDTKAIFQRGFFRPKEMWREEDGSAFNPGNYYYLGGNSKFFGAVLLRYRERDFGELEHEGGVSPAWPFAYDELEPWYAKAEQLFQVRGNGGEDPTEPRRTGAYPHAAVPDEPAIAAVRQRLAKLGLHPASLPLAVDIERWLKRAKTPWDAYPDARTGKFDAETAALKQALTNPNFTLVTGAKVSRLRVAADGKRIIGVDYEKNGEQCTIEAHLVVLAAGAVKSAALLLQSKTDACPNGIANRSDVVGRYFMNHNSSAMLAVDPRTVNDSIYQKTLCVNDFYFDDGNGGKPLGNLQLLGRVTAPILKAQVRYAPEWSLHWLSRHAVDWLVMNEDLPNPDSRITVDGADVVLHWRRSNMAAFRKLEAKAKALMRAAGYPIVLFKDFDRRTPSHQCGTVRMGTDPATSALDIYCRAHDHPNLFVVDASFLPTSAAVNPALTIAAQALRVADHMVTSGFAG